MNTPIHTFSWLGKAAVCLAVAAMPARPPVGITTIRGATTHILHILAPAPKTAADPVEMVEPIRNDMESARIVCTDGRVFEVRFQAGRPAQWKAAN